MADMIDASITLLSFRRLEDTMAMTTITAASLVADAKNRIENLSPAQVQFELASGDAVLIDIREADERSASGTIAGASHAPRGMLEFYADPTGPYYRPEFDPDRRIILHCASGGRSALAAASLQEMGYRNVAHLDGGLKLWKEQGLPVEQG
jgi:rhodanese-related sulfurtransferase